MAKKIPTGYALTEKEFADVHRALGEANFLARLVRDYNVDAAEEMKDKESRRLTLVDARYYDRRSRYFLTFSSKLQPKVAK